MWGYGIRKIIVTCHSSQSGTCAAPDQSSEKVAWGWHTPDWIMSLSGSSVRLVNRVAIVTVILPDQAFWHWDAWCPYKRGQVCLRAIFNQTPAPGANFVPRIETLLKGVGHVTLAAVLQHTLTPERRSQQI